MRKIIFLLFVAVSIPSCKHSESEENLSAEDKAVRDSLSKAEQKRKADSLKKTNPLLIIPPDSNYTGDYIDKYGNGITKFRGYFRFGKRHGQWMSFYPTGNIWSEMHYDKGLRHGPNIAYYEDGVTKRYEGIYTGDMRDSVWTYYDSAGKVREKLEFDKNVLVKKLPAK